MDGAELHHTRAHIQLRVHVCAHGGHEASAVGRAREKAQHGFGGVKEVEGAQKADAARAHG